MGLYDREYHRESLFGQREFTPMGFFNNMPKASRIILLINIGLFLLSIIPPVQDVLLTWFSVYPISLGVSLQVWRLVSYQFLHAGIFHILFNMLMLYFLGPLLEQHWGSKAFVRFYLICGAAGGVVYTLLAQLGILGVGSMVGASGAVYGLMAATAVLYPRMRVYIFGVFPMTMAVLVIVSAIISLLNFASGSNAGGEAAHLAGIAVGLVYVKYKPMYTNWRMTRQKGAWDRKIQQQREFEVEVDRILTKIHQQGIQSLTNAEKATLKEATRREQQANQKIDNMAK